MKWKDLALIRGQGQYEGRQETVEIMRDEKFMKKNSSGQAISQTRKEALNAE